MAASTHGWRYFREVAMGLLTRIGQVVGAAVSLVREAFSLLLAALGQVTGRFPGLIRPGVGEAIAQLVADDVRRLTGPFEPASVNSTVKMGNVAGTDLGHMYDMNGKLYMTFGDSFGA
jgi:hypothetical protein